MADVAEQADAPVSETGAQGRVGSTPSVRTPRRRGNTRSTALARRLHADLLKEDDKALLETVKRVREYQRKGASELEIARAVGMQARAVNKLIVGPSFKVISDYLELVERGDDAKLTDRIVRDAKSEFAQFAPDAIRYIRECFARTSDHTAWKDDAKAQWATQLVAKGLGLTEPETAVRPQINIAGHYIHIETQQVKEDDEEARNAIIDVTPVQLDA